MKISFLKNINEVSNAGACLMAEAISRKKEMLICTAAGNTPTLTYEKLTQILPSDQYSKIRIIKLDEWGGVPMDHPQTCEQYIVRYILIPFNISSDRYIGFSSDPENPSTEIARVQKELNQTKGIDICVLGLGANGHIAFNEPSDFLQAKCHIAELSQKSMQHNMAVRMEVKPTYGLTLGMGDILKSKKIVMLISGSDKQDITRQFLSGKITTQLPASFLWLHPDVDCLIDIEALPKDLIAY